MIGTFLSIGLLGLLCTSVSGDANVDGVVAFPRGRRTPHFIQAIGGDGLPRRAPIHADGSFILPLLPSGSYHVEVISSEYVFMTYRLDVSRKSAGVYRWKLRDPMNTDVKSPVTISPVTFPNFFHARPRINVFSYAPMLLTALLPLGLMYLSNTLREQKEILAKSQGSDSAEDAGVEDQAAKEMREMQEKIQGMMSRFMGGAAMGVPSATAEALPEAQSVPTGFGGARPR